MPQYELTDAQLARVKAAKTAIEVLPSEMCSDRMISVLQYLYRVLTNKTTDGMPYVKPEPEVVMDDQWAAVWPRRWVMCRECDSQSWAGPYRLGMVNDEGYRFMVFDVQDTRASFRHARPATPEEIAAVELKKADPERPDIGEGYRPATKADKYRPDRDAWNFNRKEWQAAVSGYSEAAIYRVPIDRIPTAEDAKDQPTVMVWVADAQQACRATFLNYIGDSCQPFVCRRGTNVTSYPYARHLRSYES